MARLRLQAAMRHSGNTYITKVVLITAHNRCLLNAGDFHDVAGKREMESKMRESPARCWRLGWSGLYTPWVASRIAECVTCCEQ